MEWPAHLPLVRGGGVSDILKFSHISQHLNFFSQRILIQKTIILLYI